MNPTTVLEQLKDSLSKMNHIEVFILLLFVILGFIAFFNKSTIALYYKNRSQRRAQELEQLYSEHPVREISELKAHHLFLTVKQVMYTVDNLDFTTFESYDPVKTTLIRKLISLKIETITFRFGELIEKKELDRMTGVQLKFEIITTLSNLVNEYNDHFISTIVSVYGVSEKDAIFLVDCYESFRQYIVSAFSAELENIILDDNYDNNFERMNTVLYVVSLSLSVIPEDVVQTFNKINGRFKKYKDKLIFANK